MTPAEIAVIVVRLEALHEDVREIKDTQVDFNGRLKRQELWRARFEGAKGAMSWVQPLVIALVTGSAIAGLTAVLT